MAGLVRAYAERERKPRLEYIAASAPAVEPALLAAGFVAEDRPALMACPKGAERPFLARQGMILVWPSSDNDPLAVMAVQREAFGEPTPTGPATLPNQASCHS